MRGVHLDSSFCCRKCGHADDRISTHWAGHEHLQTEQDRLPCVGDGRTSTAAWAVAEVARLATASASTGEVMSSVRPLLLVAPSSSRLSMDSTKLTSDAKGSANPKK